MPRKRAMREQERRQSPRRRVLYPAYVLFMRRRFRCRLVEIGGDGIGLAGGPQLRPGTPVIVETLLLGRRAGVVAHRTGAKLGVALFGGALGRGERSLEDAPDGE